MSRVPLAARGRPPVERTLRVRRRMLQTPVVRFAHQKTGRTVTVVGVVHMAPASYYRRLHAILATHEAAGALIFYELISRAAGTEWSAASHAERDAWNTTATGNQELSQAICRYLGWATQGEAMAYAASWRNVDMTDLELVRRAGAQALLDQREALEYMLGSRPDDERDVLVGVLGAAMMRLASLDRYQLLWHLAGTAIPAISQVVVDDRNHRVLASLPSDRDSVVFWGSGHLPGLAAGLQQAGYQRQASAWLNAGELPPLRSSAKAFWAVLRDGQHGS